MRDQVCIVLNEREPEKAAAIAKLKEGLSRHGITASHIPINDQIEQALTSRRPKIVVLDYLIGDVTTGLDILQRLRTAPQDSQPTVFFLTDEPSVHVAIQAMRLGTKNYFELGAVQSLEHLIQEIQAELSSLDRPPILAAPRSLSLDDLILQSAKGRHLRDQIHSAAQGAASTILLSGNPGSGCSTIARAICAEIKRERDLFVAEIDLRHESPQLSRHVTESLHGRRSSEQTIAIIIDHIEDDLGDVLTDLIKVQKKVSPRGRSTECGLIVILIAHHPSVVAAWSRAVTLEAIAVPDLDSRSDDIPPLINFFLAEARDLLGVKIKPFSAEVVSYLSGLTWPGSLRQLRALILEAAVKAPPSDSAIIEYIDDHRARWEEENNRESPRLDPWLAAATLNACKHNYRTAAISLGVSPRELLRVLEEKQ